MITYYNNSKLIRNEGSIHVELGIYTLGDLLQPKENEAPMSEH